MWLTDRPFYSPGFEVGAKNWSSSRVQHRLNNFGPFAKVLAIDGQTWHSLQSDMHDRSLCGVSTNLFLDESAGPQATFPWMNSVFFSGNFMPSNGVLYMVLNQLMNVWIIGTTKVETLRSKVSREVHHWATILRLFNNYLILSQWIIGYNAIDLNLEGSAVVYKLFSKWHLVFGQQQKWLVVVVLSWN